ncbi:hypothetical protein Sjap_012642 [Stephania japonica]|uniref:Uncharacterized protein n=1 Tax=Stephania japonica TaxID=461633 RepID=A0AAP0NZ46_9MAGN
MTDVPSNLNLQQKPKKSELPRNPTPFLSLVTPVQSLYLGSVDDRSRRYWLKEFIQGFGANRLVF